MELVEETMKKPRDINKEITSIYFGISIDEVTDDMINEVSLLSDKLGYSIEKHTEEINSWDKYFFELAKTVACNSKCLSRQLGAVLVRDKSIISTGYNGPPRGIPRCDLRWEYDTKFAEKYKKNIIDKKVTGLCPRKVIGFKSGQGLEICPAGHAERNALINAAREGHVTKDTTLYMTCGLPCTPCLVEIINAGVKEIVVMSTLSYDETAIYLLEQSNLSVRLFNFLK